MGILLLGLGGQSTQAGLTLSVSQPANSNSTAFVDYSGMIAFNQNAGVGNALGSVVDYTANSLTSSANFTYAGTDSTSMPGIPGLERVVETFVNNTGKALIGLTISVSGTGTPTFIPMQNASFPAYLKVATSTSGTTGRTVTNSTTESGSFSYGTGNTSVTFRFNQLLANGGTFSYYVPVQNSAGASGTLTFTETALTTPEPSSLVSAFCGALGLGGIALGRSVIRRRKVLAPQA